MISVLFTAEWNSFVYLIHVCSIRSAVDGHVGWIHFLAIVNSSVMLGYISVVCLPVVRGQQPCSILAPSAAWGFPSHLLGVPDSGLTRICDFDAVKYFRIGQYEAKLKILLKML